MWRPLPPFALRFALLLPPRPPSSSRELELEDTEEAPEREEVERRSSVSVEEGEERSHRRLRRGGERLRTDVEDFFSSFGAGTLRNPRGCCGAFGFPRLVGERRRAPPPSPTGRCEAETPATADG